MKLFSTKVHGVLDYLTVAALPVAGRALKADSNAQRYLDVAAGVVLANSLMTRYELGAVPVLPMRAHLAGDAAFGTAMLAAPSVLGTHDKTIRGLFYGLALFAFTAALTTETRSPQEIAEEGPSLGEAYRQRFGS